MSLDVESELNMHTTDLFPSEAFVVCLSTCATDRLLAAFECSGSVTLGLYDIDRHSLDAWANGWDRRPPSALATAELASLPLCVALGSMLAAVVLQNGDIAVYNATNLSLYRVLPAPVPSPRVRTSLSAVGGRIMLSLANHSTIYIYDCDGEDVHPTLLSLPTAPTAAALAPAGDLVVAATRDGTYLSDVAATRPPALLAGARGAAVAWSPLLPGIVALPAVIGSAVYDVLPCASGMEARECGVAGLVVPPVVQVAFSQTIPDMLWLVAGDGSVTCYALGTTPTPAPLARYSPAAARGAHVDALAAGDDATVSSILDRHPSAAAVVPFGACAVVLTDDGRVLLATVPAPALAAAAPSTPGGDLRVAAPPPAIGRQKWMRYAEGDAGALTGTQVTHKTTPSTVDFERLTMQSAFECEVVLSPAPPAPSVVRENVVTKLDSSPQIDESTANKLLTALYTRDMPSLARAAARAAARALPRPVTARAIFRAACIDQSGSGFEASNVPIGSGFDRIAASRDGLLSGTPLEALKVPLDATSDTKMVASAIRLAEVLAEVRDNGHDDTPSTVHALLEFSQSLQALRALVTQDTRAIVVSSIASRIRTLNPPIFAVSALAELATVAGDAAGDVAEAAADLWGPSAEAEIKDEVARKAIEIFNGLSKYGISHYNGVLVEDSLEKITSQVWSLWTLAKSVESGQKQDKATFSEVLTTRNVELSAAVAAAAGAVDSGAAAALAPPRTPDFTLGEPLSVVSVNPALAELGTDLCEVLAAAPVCSLPLLLLSAGLLLVSGELAGAARLLVQAVQPATVVTSILPIHDSVRSLCLELLASVIWPATAAAAAAVAAAAAPAPAPSLAMKAGVQLATVIRRSSLIARLSDSAVEAATDAAMQLAALVSGFGDHSGRNSCLREAEAALARLRLCKMLAVPEHLLIPVRQLEDSYERVIRTAQLN